MSTSAVNAEEAVTVVAATGVEARPLRRRLSGNSALRVIKGGVGLRRRVPHGDGLVLSCGLAGGLGPHLGSGTVVIPDEVVLAGGASLPCDARTVVRLREAARRCGLEPHAGPLVTVDHVVVGPERALWRERGYAVVDMESGRIASRGRPFAVVRVVLDNPHHELSTAWTRPALALTRPWLWSEALWLGRVAPRFCDLVAQVVAEAFSPKPTGRARGRSVPPARRAW